MFGVDDLAVGALVGFLRKYWLHILIAVAVAAWHAVVFHAGGVGPRAELEKERAEREAAEDRADFVEEIHEGQRDEAVAASNKELADARERLNRTWDPKVKELEKVAADAARERDDLDRRMRDGAREAVEPVGRVAGCPAGGTDADGLPDAVGRHLAAERSREGRERAETARLLQACERDAVTLNNARETARRLRAINQPVPQGRLGGSPPP